MFVAVEAISGLAADDVNNEPVADAPNAPNPPPIPPHIPPTPAEIPTFFQLSAVIFEIPPADFDSWYNDTLPEINAPAAAPINIAARIKCPLGSILIIGLFAQ